MCALYFIFAIKNDNLDSRYSPKALAITTLFAEFLKFFPQIFTDLSHRKFGRLDTGVVMATFDC